MKAVIVVHGGAWAIPDELSQASVDGHGAVLNADGAVELDAVIMDGSTLGCGAVSCVQNIANPVSLARAVMEKLDSSRVYHLPQAPGE
ncbi:hypothetical protein CRUP_016450 [Coryphaenoides rupestris]|nr:hypothetical protein CRUP_016450 [Coryphaenoides rupestris]